MPLSGCSPGALERGRCETGSVYQRYPLAPSLSFPSLGLNGSAGLSYSPAHPPSCALCSAQPIFFESLVFQTTSLWSATVNPKTRAQCRGWRAPGHGGCRGTTASPAQVLVIIESVFVGLYALEMVVKVMAFGLVPYAREPWNVLDATITIVGVVDLVWSSVADQSSIEGITALRSLRVLRPLRAVAMVPHLRVLVTSLLQALPRLGDVTLLYFLFTVMAAVATVNYWKGVLRYRCFSTADGTIMDTSQVCHGVGFDGILHEPRCCCCGVFELLWIVEGCRGLQRVVEGAVDGWVGWWDVGEGCGGSPPQHHPKPFTTPSTAPISEGFGVHGRPKEVFVHFAPQHHPQLQP